MVTTTQEIQKLSAKAKQAQEDIETLDWLSDQYLPGGPRDVKRAIRSAKAAIIETTEVGGIHDERKAVLQNKRVNDAIQTALERGELVVSNSGYLAATTLSDQQSSWVEQTGELPENMPLEPDDISVLFPSGDRRYPPEHPFSPEKVIAAYRSGQQVPKSVFDFRPGIFEPCSHPEPSLRQIVFERYAQGFATEDADAATAAYFSELDRMRGMTE